MQTVKPLDPLLKHRPTRRMRWAIFATFGLMIADALLRQSTLVDPISMFVTWFSALAALALVLPLAENMAIRDLSFTSAKAAMMLVFIFGLGGFTGPYVARAVIGAVAFVGADTKSEMVEARVRGHSINWGHMSAHFDLGPGTRRISAQIDEALYAMLDPYRSPGRDCLMLPVQTGRRGIRRILTPTKVVGRPFGPETYRPCR